MSTLPVRTLAQIGHLTWVASRKGGDFDAAFSDSDSAIHHAMDIGGSLGHTLLGWVDEFDARGSFASNQKAVARFLTPLEA